MVRLSQTLAKLFSVSQRELNKLRIPEVVSLFSGGSKNTERPAADPKGPLGINLLYAPAEALVDFIFVHGLGGGSRKTWSKTTSEEDFWPQEWLPQDIAFTHVRIHSFGYDSDWARGKVNILNIHHFGKSLLGQISTLPCLRDADTPIVLIGHSMGGLVIKKAYNLARQSATCQSLAKRVHSMYLLATPHRGSDSAKLLSDILQFGSISREYVAELKQDSGNPALTSTRVGRVQLVLVTSSWQLVLQMGQSFCIILHLTRNIGVSTMARLSEFCNSRKSLILWHPVA